MSRRLDRVLLVSVGVWLAAACRPAGPTTALAPGWEALEWQGGAFAALYRLSCCGHRGLLAVVRGGEAGLGLTVVAPPGAVVLDGFLDDRGSWLVGEGGTCRVVLPPSSLPLPDGSLVPLDHRLVAALLAGRIPPGGALDAPGWVGGAVGRWRWRARIVGMPPRCVGFQVMGEDGATPVLDAVVGGHRHGLPRALALRAGKTRVEAELQEWRSQPGVSPPAWLAAPPCGDAP